MMSSALPLAPSDFIPVRSPSLAERLLGSCARGALLALPVLTAVGITLPTLALGDTLGLPSVSDVGISLSNYPSYNTFYVGSGVTVQNTNQQAGDRSTGIYGDATQVWTLTNVGTITNKYNAGIQPAAVLFAAGGTVTNNGRISSGATGVQINGGPGRLVNTGVVYGYYTGVTTSAGGTVTNSSAGSILTDRNPLTTGYHAIVIQGAAGAVTNAGTITGSSGTAVQFSSGSDRLVLQSGASFTGLVDGGSGNNTIELAAGTGSLAGLGTSFTNFGTVTLDSGGSWTLTGNSTVATGVTLTSSGTLFASGTLTNAGSISATGTAVSVASTSSARILNSGGITGTQNGIDLSGAAVISNTGTITGTGGYGVRSLGTFNNTIVNAGTISGSTAAIKFGSGNDMLTLLGGAVVSGLADGGLGTNTLVLGTGTGSLAGLGTSFTNFGQVTVTNDGTWTLTGANTSPRV
jgi:hypothetical protein